MITHRRHRDTHRPAGMRVAMLRVVVLLLVLLVSCCALVQARVPLNHQQPHSTSRRLMATLDTLTLDTLTPTSNQSLLPSSISVMKHQDDGDEHDDDDDDDDYGHHLAAFYLAHVQCRRCVRDNDEFNSSNSNSNSQCTQGDNNNNCDLPDFQPHTAMKWCSSAITLATASDWTGTCISATAGCVIANQPVVTTEAKCPNDLPKTKLSCTLCTLDSYLWIPNARAFKHEDDYDGVCVKTTTSTNAVSEFTGCPAMVEEDDDTQTVLIFLVVFFALVALLCGCVNIRHFAQKKKLEQQQKRQREQEEALLSPEDTKMLQLQIETEPSTDNSISSTSTEHPRSSAPSTPSYPYTQTQGISPPSPLSATQERQSRSPSLSPAVPPSASTVNVYPDIQNPQHPADTTNRYSINTHGLTVDVTAPYRFH